MIRNVIDAQDSPIQDNKDRYLDKQGYEATKRVHLFFFIELHNFHTELCLIIFVFFLDGLDLWLDGLHFLLGDHDFLLRMQEYDTDDNSDRNDGYPQTFSWSCFDKKNKKIIDRLIEHCSEKSLESPGVVDGDRFLRFYVYIVFFVDKLKVELDIS